MEFWVMVLAIFGSFLISPLFAIPASLFLLPWAVGIPLAGAHLACVWVNLIDITEEKKEKSDDTIS